MPSKSNVRTTRYRITIEELHEGSLYYDKEEQEAFKNLPMEAGTKKTPLPNTFQEWVETEAITSSNQGVVAGLLRAKAQELDPPKPVTRGNDY